MDIAEYCFASGANPWDWRPLLRKHRQGVLDHRMWRLHREGSGLTLQEAEERRAHLQKSYDDRGQHIVLIALPEIWEMWR